MLSVSCLNPECSYLSIEKLWEEYEKTILRHLFVPMYDCSDDSENELVRFLADLCLIAEVEVKLKEVAAVSLTDYLSVQEILFI